MASKQDHKSTWDNNSVPLVIHDHGYCLLMKDGKCEFDNL